MNEIYEIAKTMREILEELETYKRQKRLFLLTLENLFDKYQRKRYTYFEYEREKEKLLKGKEKEEWINYYDSYMLYLLKKFDALNSQIFYRINEGKNLEAVEKKYEQEVQETKVKSFEPKIETDSTQDSKLKTQDLRLKTQAHETQKTQKEQPQNSELITQDSKNETQDSQAKAEAIRTIPVPIHDVKPLTTSKIKLKAPKKSFVDKIISALSPGPIGKYQKTNKDSGVGMGSLFGINLFKIIRERSGKGVIGGKTKISSSTMRLGASKIEAKDEYFTEQIKSISATSLNQEAKHIREILQKRKALKIYHPSIIGAIANLTTKKVSLWLLDTFPDFFKELYKTLRLADVKILSNTYVNLMVFGVMITTLLAGIGFTISNIISGLPFIIALVKGFFYGIIGGAITFALFYAYPASEAKSRKLSINANMPFAINHMGAVASSGVEPTKMFQLISESTEYGEIAKEAEKIVNYIEVFGYDFLTAVKSVSAITPSREFKEFFEGMVSTTQSGGDVKNFLKQKADEAMLNYSLERKKYTETISTYSDIYTGILIAAPLFFVAALSLVTMLGGDIGGMDPGMVIVLGTYVVIPILNLIFLAFLKISQPEV